MQHGHTHTIDELPTTTEGLPEARETELVELADGDEFNLEIAPVRKRVGDDTVRMLAYNGSVPGPTLKIPQGSTITIHVTNQGDIDATVHWHGLRLENRFDGTHETQAPIPVGERFTYEVTVPDPGAYWYHPHIREDYGHELGLYGNILVTPSEPDYWPRVNRELLLTLDDVLIEDGRIAPFRESETTHVAMGRFGNVMLVAGETDLALDAKRGEVVRLYLTNTANTRVFNVTLPGAEMKLVGGDSRSSTARPRRTTGSRQSSSPTSLLGSRSPTGSSSCERAATWPSYERRSAPISRRRRTRPSRSSQRWTWVCRKACRSSTSARCTLRSRARNPAVARNAG